MWKILLLLLGFYDEFLKENETCTFWTYCISLAPILLHRHSRRFVFLKGSRWVDLLGNVESRSIIKLLQDFFSWTISEEKKIAENSQKCWERRNERTAGGKKRERERELHSFFSLFLFLSFFSASLPFGRPRVASHARTIARGEWRVTHYSHGGHSIWFSRGRDRRRTLI